MRFVHKVTGKTFDDIKAVYASYCADYKRTHNTCEECGLYFCKNRYADYCWDFCGLHPEDAAEIMGYDVVDDVQTTISQSLDNKPLSEWTTQEVQTYCKNTVCQRGKCRFCDGNGRCQFMIKEPGNWDLAAKPKIYFEKHDVEDAMAVKRLYPWAKTIYKDTHGIVLKDDNGHQAELGNTELFPTISLRDNGISDVFSLDDIVID